MIEVVSVGRRTYSWEGTRGKGWTARASFRFVVDGRPMLGARVQMHESRLALVGGGASSGAHFVLAAPSGSGAPESVVVSVDGEGVHARVFTIPLGPGFTDIGDLALRRLPTRVRGWALDPNDAVVPGTIVELLPEAGVHPTPMQAPLGLASPTGVVEVFAAAATGSMTELVVPPRSGDTALRVLDRATAPVGAVLRHGPAGAHAYLTIRAHHSNPQMVLLDAPVVVAPSGPLERVVLAPAGPPTALAHAAEAGDGVLWLAHGRNGVLRLGQQVVETGLTVAAGRFLLGGVSRPVTLRASAPGYAMDRPVRVNDLSRPEVRVGLRLLPTT